MANTSRELVFNHDGYGILADLARTPMREQDAAGTDGKSKLKKPLYSGHATPMLKTKLKNQG
jgi:hypothetical protein